MTLWNTSVWTQNSILMNDNLSDCNNVQHSLHWTTYMYTYKYNHTILYFSLVCVCLYVCLIFMPRWIHVHLGPWKLAHKDSFVSRPTYTVHVGGLVFTFDGTREVCAFRGKKWHSIWIFMIRANTHLHVRTLPILSMVLSLTHALCTTMLSSTYATSDLTHEGLNLNLPQI